jgi:hypothetical protein
MRGFGINVTVDTRREEYCKTSPHPVGLADRL